MTERFVIIDCGVAETRAALIDNDKVRRFWFGPARGDEMKDQRPLPGRVFNGKVTSVDKRLDAAFVDIGAKLPAFLPISKKEAPLSEGARISVKIKRAPRGNKGATVAISDQGAEGQKIGLIGDQPDAALQAANGFDDGVDKIIINSGIAKSVLENKRFAHVLFEDGNLFNQYGASAILEDAFARYIALPSGGQLTIDETEAFVAIDIDTGDAFSTSSSRLAERINIEAAHRIKDEIERRDLGGQIVIDFLRTPAKGRETLNAALKTIFKGVQKAGWTKSGLFAFVLPRPEQSLLERFTEPFALAPLEGRQFSLDFLTKKLLWETEARLQKSSRVQLRAGVSADLKAYLERNGDWLKRLGETYGPRFEYERSSKLEGRSFDLAEQ